MTYCHYPVVSLLASLHTYRPPPPLGRLQRCCLQGVEISCTIFRETQNPDRGGQAIIEIESCQSILCRSMGRSISQFTILRFYDFTVLSMTFLRNFPAIFRFYGHVFNGCMSWRAGPRVSPQGSISCKCVVIPFTCAYPLFILCLAKFFTNLEPREWWWYTTI